MKRRVVVTGMGVITPVGNNVKQFWNSLKEGRSGAGRIQSFDPDDFSTQIACEIKDFDPLGYFDRKEAKRTDRYTQFAFAAAKEAMKQSLFESDKYLDDEQFGVIIGSGVGGISTFEKQHSIFMKKGPKRVSPFFITMMISDIAAGQIAIKYGLKGPNYAITSACASAGHAIGDGLMHILSGSSDRMMVGGAEAPITPISIAGFCSNRAMSQLNEHPQKASRPFDANRDGFVMGEGSGILILEELESAKKRGAKIFAEVAGFAATADAFHITAPPENGDGAYRVMKNALEMADIDPTKVDYINTHGTSTPVGDIAEINAIKNLFPHSLDRLKVNSTKSMTGHLLGAAAGIESIASIMSINENKVHPTINIENLDPDAEGIDFVIGDKAVDHQVDVALCNSFGFGGHNSSIVFKTFNG
ncbi:MAG: beta-ketoacyl-ACP synthase II [Candidatus Zixiibacteriota bacterium]